MRLLVTDTAAQSPRQATAWLIMTLGRRILMKIAAGIILTLIGALGTLVATPYAIIVGMMSGFSDNPKMLMLYCAAVPIIGIGIFAAGIRIIYSWAKSLKEDGNEK